MTDSLTIRYDIAEFERGISEMLETLTHREPLMREIAATMAEAVEDNFNSEGRPAWAGWSPAYAKRRAGGKILQRSGRLASSIVQLSDNDSASVGTNVKYARIHQEGGEITRKARRQTLHFKQNTKTGQVGQRFVKKSKSNFAQTVSVGVYRMTMPARPFLSLTDQDIDQLEETVSAYFSRIFER
ncbi:MAG: phage virion morphogenesis protein [Plesiomonas sp.]